MGPDNWPDWLPTDWTVNIKNIDGRTVKCYLHPEGSKCYSKPEVLDCLKRMNINTANEKTQNADDSTATADLPEGRPAKLTPRTSRRKTHSRDLSEDALAGEPGEPGEPGVGSSSKRLISRRKEQDANWLPEGWTVEVRLRKGGSSSGMKYKIYTDTISGQKFFSKPQVLNHLAKTNSSANGEKGELGQPITPSAISVWQEKSTTEPDNTQTYEATEVKKSRGRKKTESARFSSDYEVISRTPVEGLPEGWIKEVRVRKHGSAKRQDPYYLDPLSEYTFLSKKDALRYLESGDIKACVMKPIRRDVNKDDTHNVSLTSEKEELTSPDASKGTETPKVLPNGSVEEVKQNESDTQNQKPIRSISGGFFNIATEEKSDWLPDGWVTEVHYKKSGAKYKIFKEVASGKKLFSKPQVLNYLAGGSSSNSRKRKPDMSSNPTPADASRPKRSTKKKGSIQSADCQEVITTSPADGLPPGWIKEVRTKIYATHKRNDPFYTDPVSGYIFRSKMDAMRFLETGDVELCAIRPKVKDKDGNEVFVYTNGGQKPVKPTTGKRLFEDEEEDDLSTENHKPETAKVIKNPAASSGSRSSRRKKKMDPGTSGGASEGNGASPQVKQAAWVNLEKQPADDGNLSYDLPEDDTWTDQCIDFAVKTLANEILYNGAETTGANETPTKVN